MTSNKTELRQHFHQLRNNLNQQDLEKAAQTLKTKLTKHELIQTAKKIGIYLAINNELDLNPSIESLKQQNKQCFAPILHPHHQTFWFAPHTHDTRKNKFGIKEPLYKLENLIAPWELEVILVPALAVDQNKHRLGMGQGYYDRTLAFKKDNPNSKPYLIACIHHCQMSPAELPHNDLDILMDDIIIT